MTSKYYIFSVPSPPKTLLLTGKLIVLSLGRFGAGTIAYLLVYCEITSGISSAFFSNLSKFGISIFV